MGKVTQYMYLSIILRYLYCAVLQYSHVTAVELVTLQTHIMMANAGLSLRLGSVLTGSDGVSVCPPSSVR